MKFDRESIVDKDADYDYKEAVQKVKSLQKVYKVLGLKIPK